MKTITKIILCILILCMASCTKEGISLKNTSKITTEVSSHSSISHYITSQYAFNGEIPFTDTEEGKTSVDFLLETVEFFPKSKQTKILNANVEKKFNAITLEAKEAYADAKSVIDDLGYGSIAIAYEMKTYVPFVDENIASLSTNTYKYTGGAHGITIIDNSTYHLLSGNKITLSDVFIDTEDQELIQLVYDKLLSIRSKERYFEFDTIRLHENFIVNENGLQFTYNQYEIAPYSEGITDITFTFDELRKFIKSDSPIAYLF